MMYNRLFILISLTLLSFGREVTAANLLELNPTPIELNSASISDEAYQLAKVTWLPDYLGENKSHSRVTDGGKTRGSNDDVHNQRCAAYNKLGSCPSHSVGEGRKVYPGGLVCYDKCVCDMSYYKYDRSKCAAPKEVGGETCVVTTKSSNSAWSSSTTHFSKCSCPAEYNLTQDSYNIYVTKDTATCQSCTDDDGIHYKCSCPTEYKFSSSTIANGTCGAPCTVTPARVPEATYQYKCTCNNPYVMNAAGTACENDCTKYTKTSCDEANGEECKSCTSGGVTKYRVTDCKDGWVKNSKYIEETGIHDITCPRLRTCLSGYTAGVTSCSDGYTHETKGYSGLDVCGRCVCKNTNDCSKYTLTDQSDPNATYESCTTGCGAERVTKYRITSCKNGYDIGLGQCVKISCGDGLKEACESYEDGIRVSQMGDITCYSCTVKACNKINTGYVDTPLSNAQCTAHQFGDKTCYSSCLCNKGYYKNTTSWLCDPCPADTYLDEIGKSNESSCKSCPTGATTNGKNAQTSKSACICTENCSDHTLNECPENSWCTACTACDAPQKYKDIGCRDGYTPDSNGTCVCTPDCTDEYNRLLCPMHGICTRCTKCSGIRATYKLVGCEKGYHFDKLKIGGGGPTDDATCVEFAYTSPSACANLTDYRESPCTNSEKQADVKTGSNGTTPCYKCTPKTIISDSSTGSGSSSKTEETGCDHACNAVIGKSIPDVGLVLFSAYTNRTCTCMP